MATGEVAGPITGGTRGRPFGAPTTDLARAGYREAEFVLAGRAQRYAPRGRQDLGPDGRWDVDPVESTPFRTRFVVYRPVDPSAFSGTVLVCWNNVTAGFDGYGLTAEMIRGGHVLVAATVQRVGVHGMGQHPLGLAQWDPERYGSLSISSDDYSFDIFTQVARAVGPERVDAPVDPLDGLDVRHLVGMGASQSAGRLATYINAIQPLERVFEAFMPTLYFGAGALLEVGDYVFGLEPPPDTTARPRLPGLATVIRDDIDARVFIVNSEVEASACVGVRQADTDTFRYWEVAGTAHISAQAMSARGIGMTRDLGAGLPLDLALLNAVPLDPVVDTALNHLQAWVDEGTPPPSQPLIEFAGDPPAVVRDEHGIARGGIRLPQVDVPLARNSAIPSEGPLGFLGGSSVPFAPSRIGALYEDEGSYLAQFEQSAWAAVRAGVLLAHHVEPLVAEARATYARLVSATT
jgi:hypothetical protein